MARCWKLSPTDPVPTRQAAIRRIKRMETRARCSKWPRWWLSELREYLQRRNAAKAARCATARNRQVPL